MKVLICTRVKIILIAVIAKTDTWYINISLLRGGLTVTACVMTQAMALYTRPTMYLLAEVVVDEGRLQRQVPRAVRAAPLLLHYF